MSELKMNGTITKISEVQEGTAKSGNYWYKLTFYSKHFPRLEVSIKSIVVLS